MNIYIFSMSCVSGDDVQIAIHRREDILRWIKKLDHEGSTWSVVNHRGDPITETIDLTNELREEYEST